MRTCDKPSEFTPLTSGAAQQPGAPPQTATGNGTPASIPPPASQMRPTTQAIATGSAEPEHASLSHADTQYAPDSAPDSGLEFIQDDGEPTPSRRPSLPLSVQGRFDSFQFLGQGGMGVVYRARDLQLGRDVALKFLFGASAEDSERLLREARSQARLEHENACKVYEVGAVGDDRYIVMQYIDGTTLENARRRLTLEEKVRVVRQVASALHEAHRLGLVHRDVKPANIMVELGEDGANKPYLMDFGIARDIHRNSQATTEAMFGTPAFMAPEQALGDARSLDRRADIYSLGATLYDILCGCPPFADTNLLRLLQQLAHEEPAPLRQVRPEIPEDLEAIVMKCLEKEPGRRYESARALGEELQRFLDGEPVAVRRASLGYLVLKKASKHKGKMVLAGVVFCAVLAMLITWARERQLASERATLLSELAADVREMELFLRHAYSLPLHDIERDRDVIRARLSDIEQRMGTAPRAAERLGQYALGRGHLALLEPDKAIEHLRQASAAGYALPELDYAMGLSLGELYAKALEATRRIENPEQRKRQIALIESEYKTPALGYLRAALGTKLEVPAYVEGLIALYEGKHDEALHKAEEAFQKAPWLYEAKKLEGDAHFAEGSRFRHDAAFDYERMMAHFRRAAEAYRSASEIARSHPDVYTAECELWIQVMNASQAEPQSLRSSFDKAKLACERAVAASSRNGAARVKTAFAHQVFAWHAQFMLLERQEHETFIEDAITRAEQASRSSPEDPMAPYVLGAAWRTKSLYLLNRGLDARISIDRAVTAYEQALRLDPMFLWAYNELCSTYAEKAGSETWQGRDPSATVRAAVKQCDHAIALYPSFPYPYINKAIAHYRMARYLADTGRSPELAVGAALEATAAAKGWSPNVSGASNLSAWVYHLQAAFDSDAGRDPNASLARAEQSAHDVDRMAPASFMTYELRGMLASNRALHRLRAGEDPEPELRKARSSLQHLQDEAPWNLGYHISRAQVELLGLRWALQQGKVRKAQLDAAFAPLLPMLEQDRTQPQLYQTLAEIHEIRATWSLANGKPIAQDALKGLHMADKALAIHPRMAAALAVKGAIFLLQARASRDPDAQRDAAHRASDMLTAALRENPLIERDWKPTIDEAEQMLRAGDKGDRSPAED